MPGRGYLKNDTLEIRAIVRVNALANVGPAKDASHPAIGFAGAPQHLCFWHARLSLGKAIISCCSSCDAWKVYTFMHQAGS